jgi:diguanylate cyclase (GGDEF)-like protein
MSSRPAAATRILLVDDDPAVHLLAREALEPAGFALLQVESAEQAIENFDAARPDLVLLDVELPGMNGFAACRAIRRLPCGARVPVIMLTGRDDDAAIDSAYDAGATDFVTKPIHWALLMHRVRYVLRASRTLEELARSQASLANAQRVARLGSWEWAACSGEVQRSAQLLRVLGVAPGTLGRGIDAVLSRVHPEDRARVAAALDRAQHDGVAYSTSFRVLLPGGGVRTVIEHTEVSRDAAGRVARIEGIVQDVSELAEANERIRRLALYDSLTGLPNRQLFREILEVETQRVARDGGGCAVLFIDVDRFKRVNDTLGHDAGDRAIAETARRVAFALRRPRGVARFSGDEFTVVAADVAHPEEAARLARRVLAAVARPLRIGAHEVTLTASVGIAMCPADGADADSLLKHSAVAMYAAKDRGRAGYQFYCPSMNARAVERLSLESELRRALERDEFLLHYQPKVDGATGRLLGLEALLRWRHPGLGMVPPADFVPLAEETGLIVPLGEWVIRAACAQAAAWRAQGLPTVPIAVNVSSPSFRDRRLPEVVRAALAEARLGPAALEIEVTESILMSEVGQAVVTLKALKDMGVATAVDDFGTGYSSLAYLKRFPIDCLKIDRSFIHGAGEAGAGDWTIPTAIIGLARSLCLNAVAEGVETEAQVRALLERGCRAMQGFMFSRPIEAEAVAPLLSAGRIERPGATRAALELFRPACA